LMVVKNLLVIIIEGVDFWVGGFEEGDVILILGCVIVEVLCSDGMGVEVGELLVINLCIVKIVFIGLIVVG
ncbi:hypothetical protein DF186_18815, partial [Enterococcus hirae]